LLTKVKRLLTTQTLSIVRIVPAVAVLCALAPMAGAQTAAPAPSSTVTVTAQRIARPLTVDGRFDDDLYQERSPFTEFIQQDPREGEPASERTELWVAFDEENIYFAVKCYHSDPDRIIATELRRDSSLIFQNDSVTVVIDTFHDLRNGFKFQTNALGAVQESMVVDEVNVDSWNTIWEVRSARYDWGWGFEMGIPFKSIRYPGSGPQVWGINLRRNIKAKNELAYLTPMPRSFGANAIYHMGSAATLAGIETPAQSMNLEIKPYVVSSLTTDRAAASPFSNKRDSNGGFDFKYGLTRGLILDTTYRTDFAQVEEDQQQVNLTRYSLFFPEKRDFFLEGQAIYAFGGTNFGQNANPGEVPVLFFSRRIGLSNGLAVPVDAGARVAGKAGKYQLAALNIQTDDSAAASAVATNFTAVRVKREFLRRSNIGVIATRRDPAASGLAPSIALGAGTNVAYGADMNLFLFRNVTGNVYYARTDTGRAGTGQAPRLGSGQASYRGRFDFTEDRWAYTFEHLLVGPQFDPGVGFVRRVDFRRTSADLQFNPRPRNSTRIRRYSFLGVLDYVTSADASVVQNKDLRGQFSVQFQNGDSWTPIDVRDQYEFLPRSFVINPGTTIPQGGYHYRSVRTSYSLGQQRMISGSLAAGYGTLYNGHRTEAGYSGRMAFLPQFAVEPSIALNWVRLPYGDFSAPVVSTRLIVTPNAKTALTSYIQYNGSARTMTASLRLRWEYRPGSELFVVYSDGRNTLTGGYPDLLNRSVAVKVTRLLRF
jgi:hypothetical protein